MFVTITSIRLRNPPSPGYGGSKKFYKEGAHLHAMKIVPTLSTEINNHERQISAIRGIRKISVYQQSENGKVLRWS